MVGVAKVNIRVSRHLKEELAWAIDKWLRLIINIMLFKTVIPLRYVCLYYVGFKFLWIC